MVSRYLWLEVPKSKNLRTVYPTCSRCVDTILALAVGTTGNMVRYKEVRNPSRYRLNIKSIDCCLLLRIEQCAVIATIRSNNATPAIACKKSLGTTGDCISCLLDECPLRISELLWFVTSWCHCRSITITVPDTMMR